MINLKLDENLADSITRANLVDMLKVLNSETEDLEKRAEEEGSKFPDYKKIDLHDNRQYKRSIETILQYMSTTEDLRPYGLERLSKY